MRRNRFQVNKNAGIRSRLDTRGKVRTETYRRDDGLSVAASTDARQNSTRFFIDLPTGESISFGGHEARTLFRVLARHYAATEKSLYA